jgi:hypothetical protein
VKTLSSNLTFVVPEYSKEYLLNKLKETDIGLLPKIYSIYKEHVIFKGSLYIPIDRKTKYYYNVTTTIPLSSNLLVKQQEFSTLFPSMINENNTLFHYMGIS